MDYNENIKTKQYLSKFEKIRCVMANKMLSIYIINNITINFIKCMIPHHQAAIYMCENLLNYTNYQPLINIAKEIITMQTKGIEQMTIILNTTEGYTNTKQDVMCYMNRYYLITKNMICRMKNSLRGKNINLDFISEMIPHHEGAIDMCNNLLQYNIDPRLIEVAQNIIKEQSNGVEKLKVIQHNLSM